MWRLLQERKNDPDRISQLYRKQSKLKIWSGGKSDIKIIFDFWGVRDIFTWFQCFFFAYHSVATFSCTQGPVVGVSGRLYSSGDGNLLMQSIALCSLNHFWILGSGCYIFTEICLVCNTDSTLLRVPHMCEKYLCLDSLKWVGSSGLIRLFVSLCFLFIF